MTESLTDAYFAITLDICGFGNGRGVSEKMRNDGFGIYLGRVLCLKRPTGAMPVPATHLLGRKNMCRERVSRKWRVNDQLTHSFGRKSLCRGRGGMTVRKMIGFTDGRWSECEAIRKKAVYTDGK